MTIPTLWGDPGTQPIRDWIRNSIPGASAIGDVIGKQSIFGMPGGPSAGPTWGDVNKSVVSPGGAGASTSGQVQGASSSNVTPAMAQDQQNFQNFVNSGGGDSELQQLAKTGRNPAQESRYQQLLAEAGSSQENAAQSEAERRRQAAWGSYNTLVGEANTAKAEAGDKYNWVIDTLGSNKKDLLSKAALNETQTLEEYTATEKKTKTEFDTAKKDTLTGYRDMKKEQEKIMRGMGMQQSSRSMEAELKLNNLMAKDLSTVSTKEADSLALIARSVANVKQKGADLRDSIERETKLKADEATLNYQSAVNAINSQVNLAANEREDRINEANSVLQSTLASIRTWKANAQVQVGMTIAQLTGNLDTFIDWVADESQGLNASLPQKQEVLSSTLLGQGKVGQDQEASLTSPITAQYRSPIAKAKTLDELEAMRGQMDPLEYATQKNALVSSGGGTSDVLSTALLGNTAQNPLQRMMFA